ncbi:MAG: hypothetical protein ACP5KW_12355 [Thermoproteota archaeon]
MKLIEFKESIENNPSFEFRNPTLRKVANAVMEIVSNNEELSYNNISAKTGIKYITAYQAMNRFKPEEKQTYLKGQASEQIRNALGDAYANTVKELAEKCKWFGEVVVEIGEVAFMGYLASKHTPEEIGELLSKFKDPKEVVKSFKDYFANLLRFSEGASEMQKMKEELEVTKEEKKRLEDENVELRKMMNEKMK